MQGAGTSSAMRLLTALMLLGLLLTSQTVLTGAGPASAAISGATTVSGATATSKAAATFGALPRAVPISTTDLVQVEIDLVSPTALTPTTTLRVHGTVTNTGTSPLTGMFVRLLYRYEALTTRAQLQRWANGAMVGTETPNEPEDGRQIFTAPLPAQGTMPFELTVPASALGLIRTAQAFGTRGLMVDVNADLPGSGLQRVGASYTFVVWDPVPTRQPTRLTVLAPVTSTLPQGDASEPSTAALTSMTPRGRLGRLVSTIQGSGISWAVDPALSVAAQRAQDPDRTPDTASSNAPADQDPADQDPAGTSPPGRAETGGAARASIPGDVSPTSATPTTASLPAATPTAVSPPTATPTTASPTGGPTTSSAGPDETFPSDALTGAAAAWLDSLTWTAATNPPLVLPFGDPDLAALAHNGAAELLALARQQGDAVARQVLGAGARSSVAWPADGRADAATVAMLAGSSWQGIVLTASSQPPASPQKATPPGRSTVTRPGAALAGILADDELSRLLAQLGTAGINRSQATLIQQRLLAELATITGEHPAQSRPLLVTAPRTWDPDPAMVEPVLRVLRNVSWVRVQSVDALLAERPSSVPRSPRLQYPRQARAAELPKDTVDWVMGQMRSLDAIRPVLTAPQLIVPELQQRAVSLTGLAWRRHDGPQLDRARKPLQGRVTALHNGVTVLPGSDVNMVSHSGSLTMTVQNRLNQPVRVLLVLKPRSGLLQVGNRKAFTVGTRGNHTAVIPLRAVGNGEVLVDAALWTSPKGDEPIHQAQPLLIRIHSNWETIGLAIAGGVLGLLVLLGLVRSIRRGRNPLPPESAPDPEEVLVRRESGRHLSARFRRVRKQVDTSPEADEHPATADPIPGPRSERPARREP
jgi:hypothetical protein